MKNFIMISMITLSSFSCLTWADSKEPVGLERKTGKIECHDEVKICSYITQNITARELIAKLNTNLFPGNILDPNEGYMAPDGLKKVNFYINNSDLRNKLIATIPLMDTLEEFDPSDLVMLTTDIYSLTEGGLSNFQASLVTANANSTNNEIADWAVSSAICGTTGLALKIGTNLLSSLLGSNKVKQESSKITTINQLIPNMAGINFSNTAKVYISPPGSGVVKEEQAGLSVNGTVSISSKDNDLVLIKDYNLTYGVVGNVASGERVNILSITNPQLYLVKGTSSILVSSVETEQSTSTDTSALSYGKIKNKQMNKIMIVTRAESVSFTDFVTDMKKVRQLDLHQQFTKEKIAHFSKEPIDINEVLEHIKPMAYYTTSGDRVLGIKLDANDARENNIAKNIEVTIKSGGFLSSGIKQKVILPLESLMLSGIKLNTLPTKALSKVKVDIYVTLKPYGSNKSISKTLHYNPETNAFFE